MFELAPFLGALVGASGGPFAVVGMSVTCGFVVRLVICIIWKWYQLVLPMFDLANFKDPFGGSPGSLRRGWYPAEITFYMSFDTPFMPLCSDISTSFVWAQGPGLPIYRCLGTHHWAKKNLVSQGTLDTIDQSCRARLNGRAELFRDLRGKTVRALRVDKEAYVQGFCEELEHHLWSSDSRHAYRGIHALRFSKPVPQCTAAKVEGGELMTVESEV